MTCAYAAMGRGSFFVIWAALHIVVGWTGSVGDADKQPMEATQTAADASATNASRSPPESERYWSAVDLQIELLETANGSKDCKEKNRAKLGNRVLVDHVGFVHEVPNATEQAAADWRGRAVSKNDEGKPVQFLLRPGDIIRGLLFAIEGMCVGEKISVIVPPLMAYDDPTMLFNWQLANRSRPAPEGSFIRFEVKLLKVTEAAGMGRSPLLVVLISGTILVLGTFWVTRPTRQKFAKSKGLKKYVTKLTDAARADYQRRNGPRKDAEVTQQEKPKQM